MSKRNHLKHLGFATTAAIATLQTKELPMTQSNEPSIEQMNEAIAGFMGLEGTSDFLRQNYQTHKDWQLIMIVVDKIESLENKRFGVCIDVTTVIITDYKENETEIIQTNIYPDNGDTKISITHAAVYQFITWYNQQTTTNGTE